MIDLNCNFRGRCWLWRSDTATWYFINLPLDKSEEIAFFSENLRYKKRGWGAVRVQVAIGKTVWETSIFPHRASKAYMLPIKAAVRKAEHIHVGDDVAVDLKIVL